MRTYKPKPGYYFSNIYGLVIFDGKTAHFYFSEKWQGDEDNRLWLGHLVLFCDYLGKL